MSDNTAVSVEGEGKLAVNPMLPSPAKPRRNASFELLRILCMFFIIGHHFVGHGGWDGVTDEVTAAFIKLFSAFFLPSVNLILCQTRKMPCCGCVAYSLYVSSRGRASDAVSRKIAPSAC